MTDNTIDNGPSKGLGNEADLHPFVRMLNAQLEPPPNPSICTLVDLSWALVFAPFLLFLWSDGHLMAVILLGYSLMLTLLMWLLTAAMKSEPRFHFIPPLVICVSFGFSYYFLSQVDSSQFHSPGGWIAMIAFSFGTITTGATGDTIPIATTSRTLVILELSFALWMIVGVLPFTIADRVDRLLSYRQRKSQFASFLKEAMASGQLMHVDTLTTRGREEPPAT